MTAQRNTKHSLAEQLLHARRQSKLAKGPGGASLSVRAADRAAAAARRRLLPVAGRLAVRAEAAPLGRRLVRRPAAEHTPARQPTPAPRGPEGSQHRTRLHDSSATYVIDYRHEMNDCHVSKATISDSFENSLQVDLLHRYFNRFGMLPTNLS